MSFDWADDTDEAVAMGELPDFTGGNTNLATFLSDMAGEIHVGVSKMESCGTSLLRCLFYKKWGMTNMGMEVAARGKSADEIKAEKEEQEAKLWPGGGRWRVKKQSPLRRVVLA